ncbi:MAG: polyprenyl synthetase family protein [Bacillota bacterium]|nr:polyprenyl synthetase family protein [Bacillota bacterium]
MVRKMIIEGLPVVPEANAALEGELSSALDTGDEFFREVSTHLLRAGGKRLRPALVLLCAQAGPSGPAGGAVAMQLAVACEILHTATLVHDDILDGAVVRRGQPTVSALWGERVAILCGDYLFSRALTMVAELGHSDVSVRLGQVMQRVCEAEIRQIVRAFDPNSSEAEYFDIVRRKSALLIAECCRSGALLAGADEAIGEALFLYGERMGIAFQIADDILDIEACTDEVGKPTGKDVALGVLTLPVIRALTGSDELRTLICRRLSREGDARRAIEIVRASDGIEYARRVAGEYVLGAVRALDGLPPGEPRESLAAAAHFAVHRSR